MGTFPITKFAFIIPSLPVETNRLGMCKLLLYLNYNIFTIIIMLLIMLNVLKTNIIIINMMNYNFLHGLHLIMQTAYPNRNIS